jgi:hypothetical protein
MQESTNSAVTEEVYLMAGRVLNVDGMLWKCTVYVGLVYQSISLPALHLMESTSPGVAKTLDRR